jgi:hypothetical protein
VRETLYIIEVKYQEVAGSVDEKLQTCDFKRKQYLKLVSEKGLKVEYVYVLSDWFKDPRYKDSLDSISIVLIAIINLIRYRLRGLDYLKVNSCRANLTFASSGKTPQPTISQFSAVLANSHIFMAVVGCFPLCW